MNDDRYKELDRAQAELQIMWYMNGPLLNQLIDYAEDLAALLRTEGIWAVQIDPLGGVGCLVIDVPPSTTSGRVFISPNRITSIDIYGIKHVGTSPYTHNSHRELVAHLKGLMSRRNQWEAILQRCGACLYCDSRDDPKYCGMGMVMDTAECTKRVIV